jgi:excisionase family DNA binding protein
VIDYALLNTEDAAKRLSISRSTLEKLRVTGGGPPYLKLGRSVRYRAEDISRWLLDRVRLNTSGGNAPAIAHEHIS